MKRYFFILLFLLTVSFAHSETLIFSIDVPKFKSMLKSTIYIYDTNGDLSDGEKAVLVEHIGKRAEQRSDFSEGLEKIVISYKDGSPSKVRYSTIGESKMIKPNKIIHNGFRHHIPTDFAEWLINLLGEDLNVTTINKTYDSPNTESAVSANPFGIM